MRYKSRCQDLLPNPILPPIIPRQCGIGNFGSWQDCRMAGGNWDTFSFRVAPRMGAPMGRLKALI
jgi:hypothetical protein